MPLDGGTPVKSEFSPEAENQFQAAGVIFPSPLGGVVYQFAWAPSG
jgi:hypothetical protein